MSRAMGICVSAHAVRAVIVARERIVWAGVVEWDDLPSLSGALGRLAGEAGRAVRSARVVLTRDLVQSRTIIPAPPLSPTAARRYVALEAERLFRKNGAPLVTDARIVVVDAHARALWATAAAEDLLRAVLEGCAEAGVRVDVIGPAAEVVAAALARATPGEWVFPNGGTTEVVSLGPHGVWRSRHVAGTPDATLALHPALMELKEQGSAFAPAFAAARVLPRLVLLPRDTRAARDRLARRVFYRVLACALGLWLVAGAIYVARLLTAGRAARTELASLATQIDSALVLRRELEAAQATLAGFRAAEAGRSRHLEFLAALSTALGDSARVLALQAVANGDTRLVIQAPAPLPVLATLERLNSVQNVRLEGRTENRRFTILLRRTAP